MASQTRHFEFEAAILDLEWVKVARIIHKIPEDILDCNVLYHVKWQDL